jgi:SAM-dependent methyltransferase
MRDVSDEWVAGTAYEDFMGRWSRRLASQFVSWLAIRPDAHWLDVGCGTGALSEAICSGARPASVTACDPSESFVAYARQYQVDPRISFAVAAVGALPARSGGFDSVTSAFALNFFPNPEAAIDEMHRLTAAGGSISACVWDYAGRMEFLRRFWDAAAAVDPRARDLDEGGRFRICQPDALEALFSGSGLREVACESIEIATRFSDFTDFWVPFLGGTGPAPSYVASLAPRQREALAGHLERSLPREPDGSIRLTARAWVVQGAAAHRSTSA